MAGRERKVRLCFDQAHKPGDRLVGPGPLYNIFKCSVRDQRSHGQRDQGRDARPPCLFRDEKDDRQGDPDHPRITEMRYSCPEPVHPFLPDMFLDKQQNILIDLQQCLH